VLLAAPVAEFARSPLPMRTDLHWIYGTMITMFKSLMQNAKNYIRTLRNVWYDANQPCSVKTASISRRRSRRARTPPH
jgi:hypothetical protein